MDNKNGCPHIQEMHQQSIWCCYIKNSMVDIKDCKKCKYEKTLNITQSISK